MTETIKKTKEKAINASILQTDDTEKTKNNTKNVTNMEYRLQHCIIA